MKVQLKILMMGLVLLLSSTSIWAQDSTQSFAYIKFQYGYFIPSGDFEERYGNTNSVGGEIGYKLFSNWHFSFSGGYWFGSDVKVNDLLDDVINDAGDVIDADGELVKLVYEMRGQSYFLKVGKVFNVLSPNSNSGILVNVGGGYFQHQIKVDYRDGEVFQLSEDRLKGYDRLHTGFALNQFVGYQFFGKSNLLNFYAGFEFTQAFTKNRRKYNYDTRSPDTETKQDYLAGFRVGWVIPFRKRRSEEFYYY